jgi:UDP-N-acetylglucosamine 2-epimerase (non-hydrolysing)
MKKAIILGTRPEIIKLSPIIRRMLSDDFIIHTNQHYDANMDGLFFEELKIRLPKYNLNVGSGSHAVQTGKMLIGIEAILDNEKPDIVLVQGDTNSALSGALAAVKMHINVGHIEAGLRSKDRAMPEEINRILIDHISDFLFVPTEMSRNNLLREGIEESKIHLVGNTIADATVENARLIGEKESNEEYVLLTLHRAENTNNSSRFYALINSINELSKDYKIKFPIHPRTKALLKENKITLSDNIEIMEPQGYVSFLSLLNSASVVLTDSGGIQEEACILRVPCITLRTSTERPETIDMGANILMGTSLIEDVNKMQKVNKTWSSPYGESVADKILRILKG